MRPVASLTFMLGFAVAAAVFHQLYPQDHIMSIIDQGVTFHPQMPAGQLVDLMSKKCRALKTNQTEISVDAVQDGLPVRLWIKLTITPRAVGEPGPPASGQPPLRLVKP